MLKIENTEVIGLKAAIRGIRDPMNPLPTRRRREGQRLVQNYIRIVVGLQMERILFLLKKLGIKF
jgi:hypothetical protein